nr:Flp family type IVb pilin [Bacteriovorax sp. HI3]
MRNQKGQTAVEYILLLVVVTAIVTSLFGYIKTRYLGNIDQCSNPSNKGKLLCKINSYVQPTGGKKRYQYFPFKK